MTGWESGVLWVLSWSLADAFHWLIHVPCLGIIALAVAAVLFVGWIAMLREEAERLRGEERLRILRGP
jgi:hypothetical protein